MKKCVYTAITGNYDTVKTFPKAEGWEYVLFTDDKNLTSDFWQVRHVTKSDNPVKQQRDIKIRSHHYLPEYDLTVYLDTTHTLTKDLNTFVEAFYKGGMLLGKHPTRACVYQEAKQIISLGKATKQEVGRQMNDYYKERFRTGVLYETGFMVRDRSVDRLMDHWAAQVKEYTHRDQLSLPYSVKKTGIVPYVQPSRIIRGQFTISKHIITVKPKVWYISPYDSSKNIGKAINDQIALIPDTDWVCLRDGDSMFLTPNWGKQIEEVTSNARFDLIGCMTNRLRGKHQLYGGEFCNDHDMKMHYGRAIELETNHWGEVIPASGVAGLFMLFKKSMWNKVRFKEKSHTFDTAFNNEVRRAGGRIGLMKGLYVYHLYRIWSDTPASEVKHLV